MDISKSDETQIVLISNRFIQYFSIKFPPENRSFKPFTHCISSLTHTNASLNRVERGVLHRFHLLLTRWDDCSVTTSHSAMNRPSVSKSNQHLIRPVFSFNKSVNAKYLSLYSAFLKHLLLQIPVIEQQTYQASMQIPLNTSISQTYINRNQEEIQGF